MNSKTEQLLAIAQQFEQDTEDAEASLLADILRIVAEKDFSELLGLRDRMVRDENPNFHPFRLDYSGIPEEQKQHVRDKLKEGRTVFLTPTGNPIPPDLLLEILDEPNPRVSTHPE
jgi:hypothetical protein